MPIDGSLTTNLITEAQNRNMSLSAFLETLDPSSQYSAADRMGDAYTRQLARHDIRTASDFVNGITAHSWERFYEKEETKVLAYEYLKRQVRNRAQLVPRNNMMMAGGLSQGGIYGSDGARLPITAVPTSYVLAPPNVDPNLRYNALQPSMLSYLVARVRLIQGQTTEAIGLSTDTTTEAGTKMARVTEYAELPRIRVTTGETAIRVSKYGFAIDMSYEAMRRWPIDLVGWTVMYGQDNAERDKEDQAIDVLINGDGNSGTSATNTNGSTLDSTAAGKLTLKMDIAWRVNQWRRPYLVDVIAGRATGMVDRMLLNGGSANVAPVVYLASSMPTAMNMNVPRTSLDGLTFIDNSTVPANKLLGIDSRYTLEMVIEAGSDIQEAERVIRAQYTTVTISENMAFDIIIKGLNQTLDYAN